MQGDWRRALRMATGITAVVLLIGLSLSAQLDRATSDDVQAPTLLAAVNAGMYQEKLFFAVIVIGVAVGVYIATRSGEA